MSKCLIWWNWMTKKVLCRIENTVFLNTSFFISFTQDAMQFWKLYCNPNWWMWHVLSFLGINDTMKYINATCLLLFLQISIKLLVWSGEYQCIVRSCSYNCLCKFCTCKTEMRLQLLAPLVGKNSEIQVWIVAWLEMNTSFIPKQFSITWNNLVKSTHK